MGKKRTDSLKNEYDSTLGQKKRLLKHKARRKRFFKSLKPKKNKDSDDEIDFKKLLLYSLIQNLEGEDKESEEEIDNKKPDWMNEETQEIKDAEKRFNREIFDYIDYITPQGLNKIKRELTFNKFKLLVKEHFPDWKVYKFGSFCQNISTVFSDIDITVVNNENNDSDNENNESKSNNDNDSDSSFNLDFGSFMEVYELEKLKDVLETTGFSYDVEIIKAKVPILKGTNFVTDVKFDISYNRLNGYKDALLMNKIMDENKIIRQAIIILKILLKVKNLNQPYTGGMNSYLLFHLIYYFHINLLNGSIESPFLNYYLKFSYFSKNDEKPLIISYISEFLKFYGTEFNFDLYGISLNKDNLGEKFLKLYDYEMDNYDYICIEGISDKHINIGKSCFKYEKIINLFKNVYHQIEREKEQNSLSILKKLGFPSYEI